LCGGSIPASASSSNNTAPKKCASPTSRCNTAAHALRGVCSHAKASETRKTPPPRSAAKASPKAVFPLPLGPLATTHAGRAGGLGASNKDRSSPAARAGKTSLCSEPAGRSHEAKPAHHGGTPRSPKSHDTRCGGTSQRACSRLGSETSGWATLHSPKRTSGAEGATCLRAASRCPRSG
jgi:hypothetical protein